jgi:transcriptional regulator GlxA family with amidase domain
MAALATSRLALSEIALKTGFSSQAGLIERSDVPPA